MEFDTITDMDVTKLTLKKQFIASAQASVEAEGFVVNQETQERLQGYADGNITATEMLEQTSQSLAKLSNQ